MTHNSLSNLAKSLARIEDLGMEVRIVAERTLAFRPFIDRNWLDTLGGLTEGLYFVRDGVAYEKLCVIQARVRGYGASSPPPCTESPVRPGRRAPTAYRRFRRNGV